ncbi:MAG: zinc-ribbon domain-containing protein [Desulfovibrionaceae bacterium]|nr:zinc-ribbon domain-containing protein [Desulfovibrionaceae bacterium]
MVITCPNCHTQFSLADDRYLPGHKAHCSVCSHYFVLVAPVSDETGDERSLDKDEPEDWGSENVSVPPRTAKESGRAVKESGGAVKKALLAFLLLVLLLGIGLGVYLYFFKDKIFTGGEAVDPVASRIADVDKVRDLLLVDVRHRYVQNVKLGSLVVITGSVRNNFNTPKEKIRVEASLLDKEGKVLAVQQQNCGIVLTDMQLEILGKRELDAALADNFMMLANNINILPGKDVPFMVVFVYPPSAMAEYSVMVADVYDPPDVNMASPRR